MTIDPSVKILLDADVLTHFIKGEQTGILHQIYPNDLVLLDSVFEEVFLRSDFRTNVENLIKFGFIKEAKLDDQSQEVKKEYFRLIRTRGKGESAIMAYCRYNRDVLASSNLTDIAAYCIEYGITYLTTMDFLAEAFRKQMLSENECDEFIKTVKARNSRLIDSIDHIRAYRTR